MPVDASHQAKVHMPPPPPPPHKPPHADEIQKAGDLKESFSSFNSFVEIESYESLKSKIESRERAAMKLAWALKEKDEKMSHVESEL